MHHSILKMRCGVRFCILAFLCIAQNTFAQDGQDLQVGNKFIVGDVEPKAGLITVLVPPARPGLGPWLSFQYKSFFTCQIGNQIFTNNDVISPFPANTFHLNDGTSVIIKDSNKISDTIRTTWKNKKGVDIIQDVYPIAFTKSGQVVYKWKFVNHNTSPITVACQYLEDIEILDPNARSVNNVNDGPIILTQWDYKPYWKQYPDITNPLPWFYIGFLFDLPNAPSFDPGLAAMGYMDYGEPLNLIKPSRMSVGDWFTLANTIFGWNASWPMNSNTPIGPDNAVLTEFQAKSIPTGKTVEVGRTSYGTGEYEKCIGNLFSLVFYPHHLTWDPSKMVYTPNPIHIEKFVFDPNLNPAANAKITLTVGNNLTVVDSFCNKSFGKSHTKPDSVSNGEFISPGGVNYFDWWACASPATLCTAPVIDTLRFTANDPLGPPSFIDTEGDNECELLVTLDCAETDITPPEFKDTLIVHDSASIAVRDWLTSDKGLQSITWVPQSSLTDTTKVIVLPPKPAIQPCYNDKVNHIIKVIQLDSTIGGCYEFTATDCLGHQSFHTVCMQAHPLEIFHPDSLPPVFTLIGKSGNRDSSRCSNHIDTFRVNDSRLRDSGLCMLDTLSGTARNMFFQKNTFTSGSAVTQFIVGVIDTSVDGEIIIRATDCAEPAHTVDTFIYYCVAVQGSVSIERQQSLSLEANHPNPFSQITTFTYTIPSYGEAKLMLYDELGKEVARISDAAKPAGTYSIDFDGSKLPAGSYIVRLENGGNIVSRKVIIER